MPCFLHSTLSYYNELSFIYLRSHRMSHCSFCCRMNNDTNRNFQKFSHSFLLPQQKQCKRTQTNDSELTEWWLMRLEYTLAFKHTLIVNNHTQIVWIYFILLDTHIHSLAGSFCLQLLVPCRVQFRLTLFAKSLNHLH